MLGILIALLKIVLNTNMERWDAPIEVLAFVWWPICLYSGWITVATIANISAYLTKIEWDGIFLSDQRWTMIMILVATALNVAMVISRNMREFAMVGIWALIGIFVRHKDTEGKIAYIAIVGAVTIFIVTAIHAHQNLKTNPLYKLRQRLRK